LEYLLSGVLNNSIPYLSLTSLSLIAPKGKFTEKRDTIPLFLTLGGAKLRKRKDIQRNSPLSQHGKCQTRHKKNARMRVDSNPPISNICGH